MEFQLESLEGIPSLPGKLRRRFVAMAEVRMILPNVKIVVWFLLSWGHKDPRFRLLFIEGFRNSDPLRIPLYNRMSRSTGGVLILTAVDRSLNEREIPKREETVRSTNA